MPVNTSFLQDLLNSIAEQGRSLLPRSLFGAGADEGLEALALALLSGRGEASGVAIARAVLELYSAANDEQRHAFFRFLAFDLAPPRAALEAAASEYLAAPSPAALERLQSAVDSPRREFFRRLNLAPSATKHIVAIRRDLLVLLKEDQALAPVDNDLRALLQSWFNRGFLVLRQIDWQTPAAILEKIIFYEAVHEISGWDDLRRRLDPVDRRCFAFFHPALVDEPLIFVEVALTGEIPSKIAPVLQEPAPKDEVEEPTTAVFYSISNCQDGLKGISFGSFLLKQVVEQLARDRPSLRTFVTLSPVPRFSRWLGERLSDPRDPTFNAEDRRVLARLGKRGWQEADTDHPDRLRDVVLAAAAQYFMNAKAADGKPIDPVARFHLGNGARLERINWLGNPSDRGLEESHGLMVNYRYEIKEIERNHEAYANEGMIVSARSVRGLLRSPARKPPEVAAGEDAGPVPVALIPNLARKPD